MNTTLSLIMIFRIIYADDHSTFYYKHEYETTRGTKGPSGAPNTKSSRGPKENEKLVWSKKEK